MLGILAGATWWHTVRVKGMHFQLHLEGLGLLQPGHHSSSEPVCAALSSNRRKATCTRDNAL